MSIRRKDCRFVGVSGFVDGSRLPRGIRRAFLRRQISDFTSFMKPVFSIFLGLASLSYAQTTVTLDGTSGSQTFNVARSTTGGLSLGLGFEVEYLLIGGGGGGGGVGVGGGNAGGGGGGQVLAGAATQITAQSYSVTVGSGGAGGIGSGTLSQTPGSIGGASMLSGTGLSLSARGGGGGAGGLGYNGISVQVSNATSGATGGGGSSQASESNLGLAASGTVGQGYAGGIAIGHSTDAGLQSGGGGGGAGSAGAAGTTSLGGAGGTGVANSISGASTFYGGGGGGGKRTTGNVGSGGSGGGGAGGLSTDGNNGTANSGGGGGGAALLGNPVGVLGGAGGSGMVIVRYKGASAGTGGTVTAGAGAAAGYTLHTFTNTGASALNFSGLDLSTRLGAVENGVISGNGGLTFSGPGTLTLNATNTYSGITRVNAGTLALGSGGSIGTSSGVSLASGSRFNVSTAPGGFILGGAQTLSGGGTITGDTTIAGTHTPGFSPGIQTFENDLTYSTGSSIVWELIDDTLAGRGTSYDGINVGENLNFAGDTILSLEFALSGSLVNWSDGLWNSNITGNTGWKIFDVAGTISGFGNLKLANSSFVDGSSQTLASARPNASFSLFKGTDGVYLNYSAVPEPSAALLGGLGVLALLRRRR